MLKDSFCPGGFNRIYMQNQRHQVRFPNDAKICVVTRIDKFQGYGVEDVGLYYLGMYCECRNNPSENPCNPDEMIELPNVKSAMQGTNISAGTQGDPYYQHSQYCETSRWSQYFFRTLGS